MQEEELVIGSVFHSHEYSAALWGSARRASSLGVVGLAFWHVGRQEKIPRSLLRGIFISQSPQAGRQPLGILALLLSTLVFLVSILALLFIQHGYEETKSLMPHFPL